MKATRLTPLLLLHALIPPAAPAAELIEGYYNTSLGYLAGKYYSQGDRVTAFGAGAFGMGIGGDRCDLFGAAAGVFSTNLVQCTGVGHRAFKGASGMTRCVGVGAGAFEGASGLSDALWANGQLYAEPGRLWLKDDPAKADADAPILYSGGKLYLNAAEVILSSGVAFGGGGSSASASSGGSYACYVSATGNDRNDGLSAGSAFRTLDRAYLAASNGQSVAVLRGDYTFPASHATNNASSRFGAEKSVRFVAVEGPGLTRLVKGLTVAGDRVPAEYGGADGRFKGCPTNAWTELNGFTVAYATPASRSWSRPAFWYAKFDGCSFEGLEVNQATHYGIFTVCWIKDCTFSNCRFTAGDPSGGAGDSATYLYPTVFDSCLVEGSYVSFASPTDTCVVTNAAGIVLTEGPISLQCASILVDCLVETEGLVRSVENVYNRSNDNFGVRPGAVDTTFLCEAVEHPNDWGGQWPWLSGCLVGIDGATNDAASYVSTLVTNRAALAASLDGVARGRAARPLADSRDHPEWRRWRFYGCGSGTERTARDAAVEELCASLAETETVAASVRAFAAAKSLSLASAAASYAEATSNVTAGAYSPPERTGAWTLSPPASAPDDEDGADGDE